MNNTEHEYMANVMEDIVKLIKVDRTNGIKINTSNIKINNVIGLLMILCRDKNDFFIAFERGAYHITEMLLHRMTLINLDPEYPTNDEDTEIMKCIKERGIMYIINLKTYKRNM